MWLLRTFRGATTYDMCGQCGRLIGGEARGDAATVVVVRGVCGRPCSETELPPRRRLKVRVIVARPEDVVRAHGALCVMRPSKLSIVAMGAVTVADVAVLTRFETVRKLALELDVGARDLQMLAITKASFVYVRSLAMRYNVDGIRHIAQLGAHVVVAVDAGVAAKYPWTGVDSWVSQTLALHVLSGDVPALYDALTKAASRRVGVVVDRDAVAGLRDHSPPCARTLPPL